MTTRAWLQSILTAFISAFSTGAVGALALPTVFNFSHDGIWNLAKLTLVPALINVFTFLKQSPLPSDSQTATISVTKQVLPVALFMVLVGGLTGCRPVNSPAPTPIQTAAVMLDDFASAAQAAQTTEIAFHEQNLISTPTHIAIQKAFLQVAQDQAAVSTDITNISTQATVSAAVAQLTADLNTALKTGILGIKDPATQKKLIALVSALGDSAAKIAAAYGGK